MRARAIAGLIAFALSAAILVYAARDVAVSIAFDSLPAYTAGALLALSLAYAGSLGLLACAWRLSFMGSDAPRWGAAISVYGASILPKYLPGTVFQYVSRQALGQRFGWGQRGMAGASLIEIALHVVAPVLLLGVLAGVGLFSMPLLWAIGLGGAALAAIVVLHLRRALMSASGPMALQLIFFSISLALAAACASLAGIDAPWAAAAIFLVAWLIGFVIPGVPGGVGVREAALAILLVGVADPAQALLFAGLTRLVTLAGDLLFALLALALRRRALAFA